MSEDLIGLFVPIVAIVFGTGMIMLKFALDYRNRREMFQLHHAERMAAIEKGIELPPLPAEFFKSQRPGPAPKFVYLRRGVMLLLIGVVLFVGIDKAAGLENAWWGLLPSAIGVADLVLYILMRRKDAEPGEKSEALATTGHSPPRQGLSG
jgi:hypothetical protein